MASPKPLPSWMQPVVSSPPQTPAQTPLPAWMTPVASAAQATTSTPPPPPEPPASALGAFVHGVGNTFGTGDVIGAAIQADARGIANIPDMVTGKLGPIENLQAILNEYRTARKENRRITDRAKETQPAAYYGGKVLGAVASAPALPASTIPAAAGLGSIQGGVEGAAQAKPGEVLTDAVRGAAWGGAFGAAGAGVGRLIGNYLGRGAQAVNQRADQGMEEARRLAKAMAEKDVGQTVASLRGEAGGAASRVGNIIGNIEEIALPADVPRRTVGEVREALSTQIAAIEEDIAESTSKALASGVDPEDLAGLRLGEFLSKGSKLDVAQRAAKKIATYRAAAESLKERLAALADVPDERMLPDTAGPLRQAQSALLEDPRFLDVKQNVLANALSDFNAAASDATAKRAVLQEAMLGKDEAVAKRAADLLSGKAATSRLGQLALRYGPPLAGSVVGGLLGDTAGAAAGAGVGVALGGKFSDAVGALGGAGLRPAFQSMVRTVTQNPAVQSRAWQAVKVASGSDWLPRLLAENPGAMGEYGSILTAALSRGPAAFAVQDYVLSQQDAKYRQQKKAAQQSLTTK
jgi:hypothetical protein